MLDFKQFLQYICILPIMCLSLHYKIKLIIKPYGITVKPLFMKISKRNSTCMSVKDLKYRISRGSYRSLCSIWQPSGIVVYLGFDYPRVDEDLFLSLVHSRPLSIFTYNNLLHEVHKTNIRLL